VPELDDLEGALDDRVGVVGGGGGGVVGGVEDDDQAAVEAGADLVDGLLAADGGELDDDGVDVVGGEGAPGLDGEQLGDPAGAVEQGSEGETQRRVAPQEHDVAGHAALTWRRLRRCA
jgi:hypothetical protein